MKLPSTSSVFAGIALISAADKGLAPIAVEGMSHFKAVGRSGSHAQAAAEQMGTPAALEGMSNFKPFGRSGTHIKSAIEQMGASATVEDMSLFKAIGQDSTHAKPAEGQMGAHVESSTHLQRGLDRNINSGQDVVRVESELRQVNSEMNLGSGRANIEVEAAVDAASRKNNIKTDLNEGHANTEVEAALDAVEKKSRNENIKAGLIGGTVGAIGAGTISIVAGEDSQESINVIQPAGSNDDDTISRGASFQ